VHGSYDKGVEDILVRVAADFKSIEEKGMLVTMQSEELSTSVIY